MANAEHLEILKQGVTAWNEWRRKHPDLRPDLSEADLKAANLRNANLRNASLRNASLRSASLRSASLNSADLSSVNLSSADLYRADLINADLINANLSSADFRSANLSSADFRSANLSNAKFISANLSNANFSSANLRSADLRIADLSSANLRSANLRSADLRNANLRSADLSSADLSSADLSSTDLSSANLSSTDLSSTDLSSANLSNADLSNANLIRADLRSADLISANLSNVNLFETQFTQTTFGYTRLTNVNLRSAFDLESTRHRAPSSIGIDTLYKSGGKIPEVFLRGCGVPDSFILQVKALIGAEEGIQFYSCFISYSGLDDEFARRLHGRLQQDHVRVWFSPHDIQGGRKLHEQIDEAIRVYDKLLILLSPNSLQSNWVMTELRKARKAERKTGKRKLFPIRLVDYETLENWECFDADGGQDLAVEVREYFIPNFTHWKDHDAFETAYARLLKDLRAATQRAV